MYTFVLIYCCVCLAESTAIVFVINGALNVERMAASCVRLIICESIFSEEYVV